MMRRTGVKALAAASIAALTLAACGGTDDTLVDTDDPGATEGEDTDAAASGDRDLAEFFDGQRVTVVTGSTPGGGYDHTMRSVALHLPEAFEAVHGIDVQAVSQNLPGGQQLRSLQTMWQTEPDGLTIALLQPRFVNDALAGGPGSEEGWSLDEMRILGVPMSNDRSGLTCVDPALAGVSTYEEAVEQGVTIRMGETAPGGTNVMAAQLVEMLGGPIQVVYGYDTSAEHMAAFDRGETEATNRCTSWGAPLEFPDWISDGRLAPLFWSITEEDPEYLEELAATSGGTADVAHVLDLPGLDPTQAHVDAFTVAQGINSISRALYVPPGMDDDVFEFLQEVLYHLFEMEEYQETLEDGGVTAGWMTGEDAMNVIETGINLDGEGLAILEELVEQ